MQINKFESPIKLHYSQTVFLFFYILYSFESPIKLHYSQTSNWLEMYNFIKDSIEKYTETDKTTVSCDPCL